MTDAATTTTTPGAGAGAGVGTLLDRHASQVVTICGTGPSLDRLDPYALTGPRIFLNRTAFALPASEGETYWLVADDAWLQKIPGPWAEHLEDVRDGRAGTTGVFRDPLMGGRGVFTRPPAGPNIVHWGTRTRPRRDLLELDRQSLAGMNELYQHCGTGAPAIHLAWLMGARAVRLYGLDGTDGYAQLVQPFYEHKTRRPGDSTSGGGGGFGYWASKADAMDVARALEIEVDDQSEAR